MHLYENLHTQNFHLLKNASSKVKRQMINGKI